MWIKRNDGDYKREKIISSIKTFFIIFSLTIIVLSIAIKLGISKSGLVVPVGTKEVVDWLPEISLFSFVISMTFSIISYFRISTLFCQKCSSIKSNDGKKHCECGGEYIDLRKMQWVEKKSEGRKSKK